MEAKFLAKIKEDRLAQKDNSFCFSLWKYSELIRKVKCAKLKTVKEPSDYKLIKRFDVIKLNELEKLIVPLKENSEIIYFVHDEELFEILSSAHATTSHGGRDRMIKVLRKKYKNITYKDVNMFLSLCELCFQKQERGRKRAVVKPSMFKDLNSRCQVNLLDYQSNPDDGFKFILVYQDCLTKFVVLKPLHSSKSEEVADNLIDIVTLLGAPIILQSDNGRQFVDGIIENLKLLYPDLKLVRGKSNHNIDNEERVYQEVENMITTWMRDNQTSQWSKGLRFVQLMKNRASHSGIKISPYEAMFGRPLKLGLASSTIPQESLVNVQEEEDLEKIINSLTSTTETDSSKELEAKPTTSHMDYFAFESNEPLPEISKITEVEVLVPNENDDTGPSVEMGTMYALAETIKVENIFPNENGDDSNSGEHLINGDLKWPFIKEENVHFLCIVCQTCIEDNNKCSFCENHVHQTCGFQRDSETYVCSACNNKEKISSDESEHYQVKRMKVVSENQQWPIQEES